MYKANYRGAFPNGKIRKQAKKIIGFGKKE